MGCGIQVLFSVGMGQETEKIQKKPNAVAQRSLAFSLCFHTHTFSGVFHYDIDEHTIASVPALTV